MIGNAFCIRKEDMWGGGYTNYLDSIITYLIHVSNITLYSTYMLLKNRVKIANIITTIYYNESLCQTQIFHISKLCISEWAKWEQPDNSSRRLDKVYTALSWWSKKRIAEKMDLVLMRTYADRGPSGQFKRSNSAWRRLTLALLFSLWSCQAATFSGDVCAQCKYLHKGTRVTTVSLWKWTGSHSDIRHCPSCLWRVA